MLTQSQKRQSGFTLVEIMIVVAIIALLAEIALPSVLRARKRSQATATLQILRTIDGAADQWAAENGGRTGQTLPTFSLAPYIKKGTKLYKDLSTGSGLAYDSLGRQIGTVVVDSPPQVPIQTYVDLGDVADAKYWGPYYSAGS
jgi:prepilin-type N-terminal cleavage/methylation domain-containing protein